MQLGKDAVAYAQVQDRDRLLRSHAAQYAGSEKRRCRAKNVDNDAAFKDSGLHPIKRSRSNVRRCSMKRMISLATACLVVAFGCAYFVAVDLVATAAATDPNCLECMPGYCRKNTYQECDPPVEGKTKWKVCDQHWIVPTCGCCGECHFECRYPD